MHQPVSVQRASLCGLPFFSWTPSLQSRFVMAGLTRVKRGRLLTFLLPLSITISSSRWLSVFWARVGEGSGILCCL